jgi:hypothetical protein
MADETSTSRVARYPAAALVETLRGRTVVDAYCDAEGHDDVHLVLDDGTKLWIDVTRIRTWSSRGPAGDAWSSVPAVVW